MPSAIKDSHKPLSDLRGRVVVLAFFLVAASVISGIADRYYRAQKEAIEHEVRNQLLAIADLRVVEISGWRAQMANEARVLTADRGSARSMQRVVAGAATGSELAEIHAWIDEICLRFHYAGATLTDSRGEVILSTGRFFGDAGHGRQLAEEAMRTNDIVFHDLGAASPGGAIHMGMNLPLRVAPNAAAFGALLLSIDPSERLYPLLRRWPLASLSGETVLVRRDGDQVLYLSDLRFQKNAALGLRLPLSRKNTASVQAALGATGIVEGEDYRGVPVIAAVRALPNLPWFLVAKMDVEEVEAPIRRRGFVLLVATVLSGSGHRRGDSVAMETAATAVLSGPV
ncbi:MAG: cache domain-containing protein [Ignavibacteriota bacterium]